MGFLFSGREILQIAIKMEERESELYEELITRAQSPMVIELLKELKEDESKHAGDLQRLYAKLTNNEAPYTEVEATRYLRALADAWVKKTSETIEEDEIIDQVWDPRNIVDMAIKFEKESLLYFTGMLDAVAPSERELVKAIVEEERNHLEKLLELRGKLSE